MKSKIFVLTIVFLGAWSSSFSQNDSEDLFRTQEVSFKVAQFFVAGNLLIPAGGEKHPAIVYVWGSGPTNRTQYIEASKLSKIFVKSGFAVYINDKPGSGESTGEFTKGKLLHERAMIVVKEIEFLKSHPAVDPEKIGLFGASQAGYVMPLASTMTPDIKFMIAWSCPAMNSLEQSAFLVEQYLLCEGYAPEDAERASKYYIQRGEAKDYKEYLEAAAYLDTMPAVRDDLEWCGVIPENEFVPVDSLSEELFDPTGVIATMTIPVLAIFGEKDRQIDPVQGAETYGALLRESGNELSDVRTIPGADHNMVVSTTGCIGVQRDGYKAMGGAKVPPEFYEIITEWLEKLEKYL
jgi:fermentation-respiration switch protein FrsA (DUF1100 family)